VNEVGIVVTGENRASPAFQQTQDDAQRARRSIENVSAATDELDTAGSKATSSLGALSSGFELIGNNRAAEGLMTASLATDFFSGVGEAATLVTDNFRRGLNGAKEALGNFMTSLRASDGAARRWTIGLGAAAAAVAALAVASHVLSEAQEDLRPQTEALAKSLGAYSQGAKAGGEAVRIFGEDLEFFSSKQAAIAADADNSRRSVARFGQSLIESVIPGIEGTDTSLAKTNERFRALDSALTTLVQQGRLQEAQDLFNQVSAAMAENGVSVDELKTKLPEFNGAWETTGRSLDKTTDKVETQTVALQDLHDELKRQSDPIFNLIDSQKDLAEAQEAYNETLEKHGRNSPEARQALRDLTEAAINMSGAAAGVQGAFDGKLTPAMYGALEAAGLTAGEINAVERQFREAKAAGDRFAGNYRANVTVKYEVINGHFFQHGVPSFNFPQPRRHGGIQGAQSGGVRSGMTLVGEEGPELVDLPPGAQVHTTPDTQRMMGGWGGGMPTFVIEVQPGPGADASFMEWVVKNLRFSVRTEGQGSAQNFFAG
jgi:hypothetical protein